MGSVSLLAVEQAIEANHDDVGDMADWLHVDLEVLGDQLAEMRELRLLFRWNDNGVSRHGICRQKQRAA